MSGYSLVLLKDMVEVVGESETKSILSNFSCPLNKDVEDFIRKKAITFSVQGIAQTHLVFANYKGKSCLAAYFTLANKYFMISGSDKTLSYNMRKRINKFGTYHKDLKHYVISAPLIAQIGKNFFNGYNTLISGDELLKLACDKVSFVQQELGGKIVYLECEDIPNLINFYSDNGFVNFGKRLLDPDEQGLIKGKYLIQMLRYLDKN